MLIFFAIAKNGITHFTVGCRRLRSGSSGFALRRIPNGGSNRFAKIDQAVTTERRDISRRHVCRISGLYSFKKTTILENKNIIDMNVPQWLLNSMCAVWNSGIQVIYATDKIGAENYPNAYWHGIKSSGLSDYLSKLVNENE